MTAGPVGRSAEASTNPGFDAGILAYSRSKGLFAGATLEGASLRMDKSENEDFYGESSTLREITGPDFGGTSLPAAAQAWKISISAVDELTLEQSEEFAKVRREPTMNR